MTQTNLQPQNEEIFEELMLLIEISQGQLAPIIVACDDHKLRERIIERYEIQARQAKIQPYRIALGNELSLKRELIRLKESEPYLQRGEKAVFTVTGAEFLLRVNLNRETQEQTQLEQFYGYLQWTREGLREFPYPIVLWVSDRILKEMSRRAPDFWSWRKAVLRFVEDSPVEEIILFENSTQLEDLDPEDDFLPSLETLTEQIQSLESTSPESISLATLYDLLGQVYAKRVRQGNAINVEQERQNAIKAFQNAIARYKNNPSAQISTLTRLGNFLHSQAKFAEEIEYHQAALELARKTNDSEGEATALNNLGNVFRAIGQYQQAQAFYLQALEVERKIGDAHRAATSLGNLGIVYNSLGQYQQAIAALEETLEMHQKLGDRHREASSLNNLGIVYKTLGYYQQALLAHQQALNISRELSDLHGAATAFNNLSSVYGLQEEYPQAINVLEQAIEIERIIGNRHGEAVSLGNLGCAYGALGQYEQAIHLLQQALRINREIGDQDGEAKALLNIALTLKKLGNAETAKQYYEQAQQIYRRLQLEPWIQRCQAAINELN